MDTPLYRRAAARSPEVAVRIVATIVEEVPFYAGLPHELLAGEITATARANLHLFHLAVRDDRLPRAGELVDLTASAAHRAQERFPLDAMLQACHIGARVGLEALAELAGPQDTADLVAAGPRAIRYLEAMIPVIVDAYVQEQQAIRGEEGEARRALATALLAGEPETTVAELAARADLDLAARYAVLQLRLEPQGSPVAARRAIRRVVEELEAHSPGGVLHLLDAAGGPLLLPAASEDLEQLGALARKLGLLAGVAVASPGAGLVEAAQVAEEVVDLAGRLGRTAGLCRLDDVLLEHQLTRPGAAQERMATLLEPLRGHAHLLEALRSYSAHAYNRNQAAAAIHVHRNTLNYRLQRVAALTGLDPGDARDARVLAAALVVHDLR